MGKAYIDNGDFSLAEEALNQVLYYYPDLLYPHFLLSRIYYEQGDIEMAHDELLIIIDADNVLDSAKIEMVKEDARKALLRLEDRKINSIVSEKGNY